MSRFSAWLDAHRLVKHHAPHIILHVALIVALALVAVGAPLSLVDLSRQPKAPVAPVAVHSGHVCDKRDYVQGCALPQASVAEIIRGVDPTFQGVDFGWSCPVSTAKNFGASYLSYDTSKNWTRLCVDAFHAQHKGTVAVWEAGANDAQGSYSLGYSQARLARQQLDALGAGPHQPILMAIDCDCAGSSLVNYFRGANAAEPHLIDAYGGYYQIQYLYGQHLVGHVNWQTYAWSGGLWLPASVAPLEQYLNSSSVGYDRAIAAYYGQWPNGTAKPKPKPASCWAAKWPHTATCTHKRRQAYLLRQAVKRQLGYLRVSQQAIARLEPQVTPLKVRLSAIDVRAQAELRAHKYTELKVSAQNALAIESKLVPLDLRLGPVLARAKAEQGKAAASCKHLVALGRACKVPS